MFVGELLVFFRECLALVFDLSIASAAELPMRFGEGLVLLGQLSVFRRELLMFFRP